MTVVATGGKLTLGYAGNTFSFASVSELRTALLASYPGLEFFTAPVAATPAGRDWDTHPAWGWVDELIRARRDWWPAIGVALQHAVTDGGSNARIALADLLESYPASIVLLDWTAPLAARWPDASPSYAAIIEEARRPRTLAELVADQRRHGRAPIAGFKRSAARIDASTAPTLDLAPIA